jgi:hypothetical protein
MLDGPAVVRNGEIGRPRREIDSIAADLFAPLQAHCDPLTARVCALAVRPAKREDAVALDFRFSAITTFSNMERNRIKTRSLSGTL